MLGWPGRHPGRCRDGEVRCESGAVPQLRCPDTGDEPGRPLCAETNASPRRRGGSCGNRRRHSSSADAEVFIAGQKIQSQPRPSTRPDRNAAPAALSPDMVFALSWSGGKDSALALWMLRREQREPEALITTVTESYERVSMHGVRRELLARQAEALGLPLIEIVIPPACVNDVYEARMAEAFAVAPLSTVEAVAFGDLFLEDVRAYREERLRAGGKRGLFPLWGRNTTALAREFLDAGFEATLVCVDPRALDGAFAGR